MQICSLSPICNRAWSSGRPELAGSEMAMLFSLDSQNLDMLEIWACDLLGGRTQWFFHPLQIWAYDHEHAVIWIPALIQDKERSNIRWNVANQVLIRFVTMVNLWYFRSVISEYKSHTKHHMLLDSMVPNYLTTINIVESVQNLRRNSTNNLLYFITGG